MSRHRFLALAASCAMLGSLPALAHAQQATTVSGRVTSTAQTPVPNVSVAIASLGVGATTGEDGRYSFTVPASRSAGQTVQLTARRIGYEATSVNITLSGGTVTQDFALTRAAAQLTGVVVTALSQQREKSTIGTAQTVVSGEALTQVKQPTLIASLSGKVAGLQINQSGNMGGSQRIVIRGAGSILGQNQPLFIVDGVPMSNAQFTNMMGAATAYGGRDYGTGISDLNMDDVASVTVLKGPNAAALYGSRAANGAVVITTKTARSAPRGTQVSFTSRLATDVPSVLPDYQNQYGQGFAGQFQYVDGRGGGINDGADESWGPKLDGRLIDQYAGKQLPWVPHPNNVRDYFRTGSTISNNVAVTQSFENAGARLSITRDDIKGIVPNSSLGKTAASLSANATINNKVDVTGSLMYVRNHGMNRTENGYTEGNPLMSFTWFGRQVDIQQLASQYYNKASPYGLADGSLYNWNQNYHRNPYWQVFENPAPDSRDRVVAQASATYNVTSWLTGVVRGGTDTYRQDAVEEFAKGNIDRADPSYEGAFTNSATRAQENTFSGLLTAKRGLSFLDLTMNVGGTIRRSDSYRDGVAVDGILVPHVYNLANAGIAPSSSNAEYHSAVNSSYGSLTATLNGYWTVDVTGRNDWSSTLPKENASYFYPSVSSSLVLSDMFPSITSNGWLTYLKLRGGWTRVGADAAPYQLATVYNGSSSKFGGLSLFSLDNQSANANLKPENTTAEEGGIEMSLFNDRLTFDGTYYVKKTRNQIIPLTTAPATGFSSAVINAGQMSNRGFEASVTAHPIRMGNGFSWSTTFNYARNKSRVDSLAPGLSTIIITSNWSSNIEAREGEPYGVIFGYAYARDEATGKLLLDNGLPTRDPNKRILGNVNPDWTGGWANEFRYKNLSLNVLVDFRRGGQNFSVGNWWGTYAGVLKSTLKGREIDWNDPGLVIDGIDIATGQPNTITVTAEDYNHTVYPINEAGIFNTGFTKLREVRLGWDLPQRLVAKAHASQVNLSFVGRNLFTWTDFPNFDPENSTNAGNGGTGYDMGAMPTNRTLGINISVVP